MALSKPTAASEATEKVKKIHRRFSSLVPSGLVKERVALFQNLAKNGSKFERNPCSRLAPLPQDYQATSILHPSLPNVLPSRTPLVQTVPSLPPPPNEVNLSSIPEKDEGQASPPQETTDDAEVPVPVKPSESPVSTEPNPRALTLLTDDGRAPDAKAPSPEQWVAKFDYPVYLEKTMPSPATPRKQIAKQEDQEPGDELAPLLSERYTPAWITLIGGADLLLDWYEYQDICAEYQLDNEVQTAFEEELRNLKERAQMMLEEALREEEEERIERESMHEVRELLVAASLQATAAKSRHEALFERKNPHECKRDKYYNCCCLPIRPLFEDSTSGYARGSYQE